MQEDYKIYLYNSIDKLHKKIKEHFFDFFRVSRINLYDIQKIVVLVKKFRLHLT
jgi:flagellar motor switch protein FliG